MAFMNYLFLDIFIPGEFQDLQNPYSDDQIAIKQGKDLLESNCKSCHGESGAGNGPVAKSMDPMPGSLDERISNKTDDYLYWRINEGGMYAPFNSLMPAWKNILDSDQIWQVITFVRTFDD